MPIDKRTEFNMKIDGVGMMELSEFRLSPFNELVARWKHNWHYVLAEKHLNKIDNVANVPLRPLVPSDIGYVSISDTKRIIIVSRTKSTDTWSSKNDEPMWVAIEGVFNLVIDGVGTNQGKVFRVTQENKLVVEYRHGWRYVMRKNKLNTMGDVVNVPTHTFDQGDMSRLTVTDEDCIVINFKKEETGTDSPLYTIIDNELCIIVHGLGPRAISGIFVTEENRLVVEIDSVMKSVIRTDGVNSLATYDDTGIEHINANDIIALNVVDGYIVVILKEEPKWKIVDSKFQIEIHGRGTLIFDTIFITEQNEIVVHTDGVKRYLIYSDEEYCLAEMVGFPVRSCNMQQILSLSTNDEGYVVISFDTESVIVSGEKYDNNGITTHDDKCVTVNGYIMTDTHTTSFDPSCVLNITTDTDMSVIDAGKSMSTPGCDVGESQDNILSPHNIYADDDLYQQAPAEAHLTHSEHGAKTVVAKDSYRRDITESTTEQLTDILLKFSIKYTVVGELLMLNFVDTDIPSVYDSLYITSTSELVLDIDDERTLVEYDDGNLVKGDIVIHAKKLLPCDIKLLYKSIDTNRVIVVPNAVLRKVKKDTMWK